MLTTIIAGPRPPLELRKVCPECANRGWYYDDHGGNVGVQRHCGVCDGALKRWYLENMVHVEAAMAACGFTTRKVVSGRAPGFDTLGERWAAKNNLPVEPFPADWKKYGKKAGFLRNMAMGDYADALVAVVADPPTRGTSHMVTYMKSLGKAVHEHKLGAR